MRRFTDVVRGGGEERPTNPLGLMGHGNDIAYMVLFLCSPAARFLSGQVIAIDGAGTVDQLKLNLGRV
jgi:NAD(P)-dependent dehydrogenase (short-subunit alcohol dehydrogenase family)